MDLPESTEALRAIIEKATAEAAGRGVSEPAQPIPRIVIREGDPIPDPPANSNPLQPSMIVRVIVSGKPPASGVDLPVSRSITTWQRLGKYVSCSMLCRVVLLATFGCSADVLGGMGALTPATHPRTRVSSGQGVRACGLPHRTVENYSEDKASSVPRTRHVIFSEARYTRCIGADDRSGFATRCLRPFTASRPGAGGGALPLPTQASSPSRTSRERLPDRTQRHRP
jgi:hypothetical protein